MCVLMTWTISNTQHDSSEILDIQYFKIMVVDNGGKVEPGDEICSANMT